MPKRLRVIVTNNGDKVQEFKPCVDVLFDLNFVCLDLIDEKLYINISHIKWVEILELEE